MSEDASEKVTNKEPTSAASSGSESNINGLAICFFVLTLIAAGVAGYYYQQMGKEKELRIVAEQTVAERTQELRSTEDGLADVKGQLADQLAEQERMKTDYEGQIAKLRKDHREQLARTYSQMNDIIFDGRKTLEYIGAVEDKLKAGQALDEKEAARLIAIGNGLALVHEQYEKPLYEFRALEGYLTDQLQVEAEVPPDKRMAFFKRIFSPDFREQEQAYFRDQGRREAFERARTRVSEAYGKAQQEMEAIALESDAFLDQLEQIAVSNKASSAEVDAFLKKSKEILKVHDRIMQLEPEELPELKP